MLFIVFFLTWVVFNGQLTLEIALFGIVIAAFMSYFAYKFMGQSVKNDVIMLRLSIPGIAYLFVLLWEIIKANFATGKLILSSKYENDPVLVEFDVPLETRLAQVILANSITLTPGTITANIEGNHLQVHCLDRDMAVGLDSSVFVMRLKKMEEIAKAYKEKRVSK